MRLRDRARQKELRGANEAAKDFLRSLKFRRGIEARLGDLDITRRWSDL